MPEEKKIAIGVELPISPKEFAKKPVTYLLYLSLLACVYLYIDLKRSNNKHDKEQKEIIADQNIKIANLYAEQAFTNDRLRRADSSIAYLTATLKVLRDLKKIE